MRGTAVGTAKQKNVVEGMVVDGDVGDSMPMKARKDKNKGQDREHYREIESGKGKMKVSLVKIKEIEGEVGNTGDKGQIKRTTGEEDEKGEGIKMVAETRLED